jgi:hypothetical protein
MEETTETAKLEQDRHLLRRLLSQNPDRKALAKAIGISPTTLANGLKPGGKMNPRTRVRVRDYEKKLLGERLAVSPYFPLMGAMQLDPQDQASVDTFIEDGPEYKVFRCSPSGDLGTGTLFFFREEENGSVRFLEKYSVPWDGRDEDYTHRGYVFGNDRIYLLHTTRHNLRMSILETFRQIKRWVFQALH